MGKSWKLGLLLPFLILSLCFPLPAVAQGGIRVTRNEHAYTFRDRIAFRLEAEAEAEISAVTLFVRVSGEAGRQRDEPEFEPGKTVSVEVAWEEMEEEAYRPPGVEIAYWWVLEDAAGNRHETDPVAFVYMDDQHPWQVLENEALALYWYSGDQGFGRALFERADQAMDQISTELGVQLEDTIRIFIYGSYADLRASLGEGSHEWVGGISFTDYGIIAVGAAPDNVAYGLRVIPHELSHAAIAQMMAPPFGKLPHWMDEGLAMHYEGALTGGEQAALEAAIQNDALLSIRSLASNFPEDSDLAVLSYAESSSVVEYLFEVYGSETVARLLEVFAVGAHQDDGFMKVLGIDVDGLEDEWRAHIGAPPRQGETRATPVLPTATPVPRPTRAATDTTAPPTATPQAVAAATETPAPATPATTVPQAEPAGGPWCPSPLAVAALLGLVWLVRPQVRG
jgi:hypothetical protein